MQVRPPESTQLSIRCISKDTLKHLSPHSHCENMTVYPYVFPSKYCGSHDKVSGTKDRRALCGLPTQTKSCPASFRERASTGEQGVWRHLVDKCSHLAQKAFRRCREQCDENRNSSGQIPTERASPAGSGESVLEAGSAGFLFGHDLPVSCLCRRPPWRNQDRTRPARNPPSLRTASLRTENATVGISKKD